MGTIGILMAVNANVIQEGIDSNLNFANQMNIAGRQRGTSLKIVNRALVAQQTATPDPVIIHEANQWNNMHEALQKGSTQYNLPEVTDMDMILLYDEVNPVQEELYDLTMQIGHNVPDALTVKEMVLLQRRYGGAVDKILDAMQRKAEASFIAVRDKQVKTAILSGLVLILEILLMIIPYHRRLLTAYRDLKAQKLQVLEQKEEIHQQNEMLAVQNQRLEEYQTSKELMLNGINAGVWNWNINTGEENWSPRFFTLLGYTPGELPATFDTFMNVLLHADDKEQLKSMLAAHLEHDVPFRMNVRMRNKDGQYRWYETSGKAARNEFGKAVQMAGSIIDNTEKLAYQTELENSNATKDKLFAIVAHDLRSPLAGIRSLVDLQSEGLITQDEFMEYLGKLKESMAFLSETLDNILHWAMSQMNGFSRTPELLNMRDVTDGLQQFYKSVAQQKNITITTSGPAIQMIMADKNHISLAVRNLLSNALKFTPERGTVKIIAATTTDAHTITIQDTGRGMTEAEIQSALQLKGNYTTPGTNGEKGTGLGLNLCQTVIKENGGSMHIISAPGKGTSVTISFPEAMTENADTFKFFASKEQSNYTATR
jgi:PAS domain S-box-containing protein